MALLQSEDGRTFECETNSFIGRGLTEGISFDEVDGLDLEVSSVHAAITWNGKRHGWELRDLGSHNHTFVGDRRLPPGEKELLKTGDRIVIGRIKLTVLNTSPPPAHATCEDTDEVRIGRDGALMLPDEATPEVAVLRTAGGWFVGRPDELQRSIDRGETAGLASIEGLTRVEAGGRMWKIRVPSPNPHTLQSRKRLADYELVIEVMDSGDRVGLALEHAEGIIPMRPRVHHEMLWVLALARLADQNAGRSEAEQGWRSQEQVLQDMGLKTTDPAAHLNILVHRARHQMEPHAPTDFMQLIERDPSRPGELRIGTARLRIDDHGPGRASRGAR
jgi:hypothetical protein